MNLFKSTILVAIIGISFSASLHATNGYFAHGFGVKEKAMAGAGVAYSVDALAAGTNPAGMVGQGNRQDIGGAIFSPMRSYTSTGSPSAPVGASPCNPTFPNPPCPFSIGDGNQSIDSENEAR